MNKLKELLLKYREFKCEKLDWHKCEISGFDGVSFEGQCKYCGKMCLQDSQGNWFSIER